MKPRIVKEEAMETEQVAERWQVWMCPDCERVCEVQQRWSAGVREWGPFCRHGRYEADAPSTQAVPLEMVPLSVLSALVETFEAKAESHAESGLVGNAFVVAFQTAADEVRSLIGTEHA